MPDYTVYCKARPNKDGIPARPIKLELVEHKAPEVGDLIMADSRYCTIVAIEGVMPATVPWRNETILCNTFPLWAPNPNAWYVDLDIVLVLKPHLGVPRATSNFSR